MTCPTLAVMAQLEQALHGIQQTQGYSTDLGASVHQGFYATVIHQQSVRLPCVCIELAEEDLSGHPAASRKIEQQYRLIIATKSHLPDTLYQAAYDVRKSLYPHTQGGRALQGHALYVRAQNTKYASDPDSGISLAVITLDVGVIETYQ